jgi:hypothetical protein
MKLVIDQNRLRSKAHEANAPLEAHLATAKENLAVLTDTAVFEILKGSAPTYVASKSLEILSRFPDQVIVTDGTGVLMRKELTECKPIAGIASHELTQRFRAMLRKASRFYAGQEKTFPLDEALVAKELPAIKAQRLDHQENKKVLTDGVAALKKQSAQLQRKIRKGVFDKEVYEFVYQAAFVSFRDAISDFKLQTETVNQLYLDYCLTARVSMVGLLFAMQWFETNGADTLKEEAATNQFIDNDYVVCATYFDGILSEEGRVNALYGKLKSLLEANCTP